MAPCRVIEKPLIIIDRPIDRGRQIRSADQRSCRCFELKYRRLGGSDETGGPSQVSSSASAGNAMEAANVAVMFVAVQQKLNRTRLTI